MSLISKVCSFRSISVAAPALVLAALTMSSAATSQDNSVKALSKAYGESGQELFTLFAKKPGNIVFSPYSIGTAMAMALSGARGETEKEMIAVLKHRLKRDEIGNANRQLLALLNGYDKSAVPPSCPEGMRLNGERCEATPVVGACARMGRLDGELCVDKPTHPPSARLLTANALMLPKKGGWVATDYVASLQDRYAAEVFEEPSLEEVNGWVKRKTEGKIDKILKKIRPSDAVILNAIYFKARWASTFRKEATRDDDFNLTSTAKAKVPMMRQQANFSLEAGPRYRAIRLPYQVGSISMVIVLPDEIDGLEAVRAGLGAGELSKLFASLRGGSTLVSLFVPRFKASFDAELKGAFTQAGMRRAFDARASDFSGMITPAAARDAVVAIDAILHRAVIEVSEESTEAAAVTAIIFGKYRRSINEPPKPEVFNVDRPFLFYIVEDATDAILFQGRIVDPR
jgi:serpin B